MNKRQFMDKLRQLIPASEVQEILIDFEEHFATGLAEGKTEEQIVEELGDPVDIAAEYGYTAIEAEPWRSTASASTIVMASIGLVMFDLLIGAAVVVSLFSVWISLWAVVVSLLITAVACIFSGIFVEGTWLLGLVTGISLMGLTVLFGIGMLYVTRYFWKALVWYGRLHAKVFKGQ